MVRAQAAREPGEPDDTIEKWGMTHPLGRTGDAREVANVVLFLASEKASFMTGEYVNVDGGMMALGAWASGSGASADGSIRN